MSKQNNPETEQPGSDETPAKPVEEPTEAAQEASPDESGVKAEVSKPEEAEQVSPSSDEMDGQEEPLNPTGDEPVSEPEDLDAEVAVEAEVLDKQADTPTEAEQIELAEHAESAEPTDQPANEPVTDPTESPAPVTESTPKPTELMADEEPEPHQSSFASTALMLLLGAIFVSGLTLWGAPKLAPYLPGSLAKYLAPASETAQAEISNLKGRIEALEEVRARVAVLEAVDMGQVTDGVTAANEKASANQSALNDLALLVSSIDSASQEMSESTAQLTNELATVSNDLAAMKSAVGTLDQAVSNAEAQASGAIPVTTELQAAVTELQTKLSAVDESLQVLPSLATKADLEPLVSAQDLAAAQTAMAAQIAEVSAKATAAHETGTRALNETQSTLKGTAICGLSTQLRGLVIQGAPYATTLREMEELSGTPAPDALAGPSEEGIVSMAALRSSFAPAARAALAADTEPVEGEGAVARISSWLNAQVSVRPTQPIEGGSTGAVLSRMEAAVNSDDGTAALLEAEGLSDAAAGAMADWLAQLSLKVGAEAALAPYIAAIGGES
ncbi:MAG: hypothetical protein AAGC81_13535 [Pseudomonadota bacterium]